MSSERQIFLLAVLVMSGCATNTAPVPVQQNPRVVTRDLVNSYVEPGRPRVVNANLLPQANAPVQRAQQQQQPPQATQNTQAQSANKKYRFDASDLSYKQTITRWAKMAGWQVAWEAEKDFPGRLMADISNDFEEAVQESVKAYKNTDYPLKACGYDNRVMRVVRYLGTGKECDLN
jgi:hypothetical protein